MHTRVYKGFYPQEYRRGLIVTQFWKLKSRWALGNQLCRLQKAQSSADSTLPRNKLICTAKPEKAQELDPNSNSEIQQRLEQEGLLTASMRKIQISVSEVPCNIQGFRNKDKSPKKVSVS